MPTKLKNIIWQFNWKIIIMYLLSNDAVFTTRVSSKDITIKYINIHFWNSNSNFYAHLVTVLMCKLTVKLLTDSLLSFFLFLIVSLAVFIRFQHPKKFIESRFPQAVSKILPRTTTTQCLGRNYYLPCIILY